MGSWNRRNQISSNDAHDVSESDFCVLKLRCGLQEFKDLLIFGYASSIFPNDYQSENIAEERHMVPCLGDAENRVDR